MNNMIDNLKKDVFYVNKGKKTVIKHKKEINEALLSCLNNKSGSILYQVIVKKKTFPLKIVQTSLNIKYKWQ